MENTCEMSLDLVGFGSAIIDFAPANLGVPLSEVESFVPYAGGAVANVLVAASRLGLKTRFLGCVGDDEFGAFIIRDFKREGVDTSCVKQVKGRATGIAFYSVDEKGERHYVFYRFPGYADPESTFRPEDIKPEYISKAKALHFSESGLRHPQTRGAVFHAVQIARKNRLIISYDPNMRPDLWDDRKELLEIQRKAVSLADIFVATFEEAKLIVGETSPKETVRSILALGPSTVVIREKLHYQVATRNRVFKVPVFRVKAVDTSGAGDAFDAGFLTGFLKDWSLEDAVRLGSAVAALKVSKAGTRAGLPRMKEALEFMRTRRKGT